MELYIKDTTYKQLEIDDELSIELDYELNNYVFNEFNNSISKTIVVKNTPNNNAVLKNLDTGLVDSTALNNKIKARLELNNGQVLFGNLIINKIVKNLERIVQYECTFIGDLDGLFTELRKHKLNELANLGTYINSYAPFEATLQAIDYPNIAAGLVDVGNNIRETNYTTDIAYDPYWNSPVYETVREVEIDCMRTPPLVQLKYLIDKIFEFVGYNYTSNSFQGCLDDLNRMYILTNNYKRLNEFASAYGGNTQEYTLDVDTEQLVHIPLPLSSYVSYNATLQAPFMLDNTQPPYYHNGISIFDGDVGNGGRIALSGSINSILKFTFLGKFMNLEIPCKVKLYVDYKDINNNDKSVKIYQKDDGLLKCKDTTGMGEYNIPVCFDYSAFTDDDGINIIENLRAEVEFNAPESIGDTINNANCELKIYTATLKIVHYTPILRNLSDYFTDDITLDSFMIDIMKLFNLCYYQVDEKIYYFDTFDKFIDKTNIIDITNNIDIGSNIELESAMQLAGKRKIYKFADNNDYWHNYYKEVVGNEMGSKILINNTDVATEDREIELTNIMQCPIVNGVNGIPYAQIVNKSDNGEVTPLDSSKLGLLYFTGILNTDYNVTYKDGVNITSSNYQVNKIALFTNFTTGNSIQVYYYQELATIMQYPSEDIAFENNKISFLTIADRFFATTNNIYYKYYLFIDEMIRNFDEYVMKVTWQVPANVDIKQLFSKLFYFNNSYYVLLKIEGFSANKNRTCKATFLKYTYAQKPSWTNMQVVNMGSLQAKDPVPHNSDSEMEITVSERINNDKYITIPAGYYVDKIYYLVDNNSNVRIYLYNNIYQLQPGSGGWLILNDIKFNNNALKIETNNNYVYMKIYLKKYIYGRKN
jgi:hypothetical protein